MDATLSYILKRFSIVVAAAFLLIAPLMVSLRADAQTTSSTTRSSLCPGGSGSGAIIGGLWGGINLATGRGLVCTPSGTPTATPPPPTTPSAPTTPPPTSGGYVALGDSVAAGVGLSTPLSVPADEARCGRTAEGYPQLVAERLNRQVVNLTCSGATVGDLFTVQRSGSPNQPAQLDRAFASGTPDLITITAGANDAQWLEFLLLCYNFDCATAVNTAAANAYLVSLQVKLLTAMSAIDLRSGGDAPRVVITGYYNPISSACVTRFPNNVTPAEVTWMTAEVNALNQTIRQVAALYPNVRYAPVSFSGHDICSASPWIQGIGDPRPFHPTAAGQRVMADAVVRAAR